ncbi:hypothetical protein Tcan_02670 [Toxocara canis]|uniref:Uncharacterized protein n=1 Tax=Toxocara canis TaxID=6265 RepID=A0A0B2VTJ8_TOXCA|nr:hypothetical protein Tcan_02670 [Toxocara canis]
MLTGIRGTSSSAVGSGVGDSLPCAQQFSCNETAISSDTHVLMQPPVQLPYAVMPQPVMMPGVQYCVMQPVPQFQVEQPYAQGMPMQQSYGILPQPTISGLQQNTQLIQVLLIAVVSVQTSNPCGNMPPQSCYSQPCARSASVRASLVANAPTGFERHFMPSRSTSQMAVQSPREQAVCVQQPSGVCMNLSLSVDLPPRSFPVTPTAFQTRAQSEQKQYPAHLPGAVILDDGRLAYLHPHQSHTQVPLGPVPSQPVPRMHFVTTSQTVQPVNRMQIPQFVPQGQPYLMPQFPVAAPTQALIQNTSHSVMMAQRKTMPPYIL